MSPRTPLSRNKRIWLRLDKAALEHVQHQIKSGAFKTQNDYFLWLITQHRSGQDAPTTELGEIIATTIDNFRIKIRRDIASARKSAELSNAFLHALVKMMLVNFPEPDAETRRIGVATAHKRYNRLLINAVREYDDEKAKDEE